MTILCQQTIGLSVSLKNFMTVCISAFDFVLFSIFSLLLCKSAHAIDLDWGFFAYIRPLISTAKPWHQICKGGKKTLLFPLSLFFISVSYLHKRADCALLNRPWTHAALKSQTTWDVSLPAWKHTNNLPRLAGRNGQCILPVRHVILPSSLLLNFIKPHCRLDATLS